MDKSHIVPSDKPAARQALKDLARAFRMRGQPAAVEIRLEQLLAIDDERKELRELLAQAYGESEQRGWRKRVREVLGNE